MSWPRAVHCILVCAVAVLVFSTTTRANPLDEEPVAADDAGWDVEAYRPGEGVTLRAPDGHRMRISGYAQPSVEIKSTTGDLPSPTTARFRMRRLRMRIEGGTASGRLDYRLQLDLAGQTEADVDESRLLLDGFFRYRFTRTLKASFGQRSTFTDNRELFMLSQALQLPERSRVTSAFAAIREVGVFVEDRYRFGQSTHYLKPYLIVTTGDGASLLSRNRGGIKVGGRLDYLPFGLFTNFGQFREVDVVRELTPKLVIGTAFSHNSGMSSRRGRESGAILYLNEAGEEDLPDFSKLSIDLLFKYRGLSVIAEFNKTWASVPDTITQRVRNDGSISTDFGGDVDAYVRGRMMLGEGYNLQAGYLFPFRISLDGRITYLVADENSFLNNGTFYNRNVYTTVGASALLRHDYSLRLQTSLTHVNALDGSNDINGAPIAGDEWLGRIITTVAF